MATDGSPERSTRRFGEEIARLRVARGWSRTKLISQLHDELDDQEARRDSLGETWLARLETGRVVKVPRHLAEALCRALHCTPKERARLLLYGDRNVLAGAEHAPDRVAEVLTYLIDRLYADVYDFLSNAIGNRQIADLDDQEVFELCAAALELQLRRRRPR